RSRRSERAGGRTILSRKRIFKGRLINVFAGKKKLPGGRIAYFEQIDHPGSSVILPLALGKIVFIRQYRAVIGKYIWELPAGTIARGETPYACAKREITEETGYKVKNLRQIGAIYTTPGFCNEKIYIFKADCIKKKTPRREKDEQIRVKLFSRKEAKGLFKRGKITDSKTIATLAFANII
ncbi:MAG: NUDIX hydrolase, partial [Candidatus Omnitrophota bacterium]